MGGGIITNAGKRLKCTCLKTLSTMVGKKDTVIFMEGKTYSCIQKRDQESIITYKVYGDEFDFSCSEKEFVEYFKIIQK